MSKHRSKHSHPHHEDGKGGGKKNSFYSNHLNESEIAAGVENGTIYIGTLKVFAKKRRIAYVSIPGHAIDVLIEDERARNRAHHGDEVYLLISPESHWNAEWTEREAASSAAEEHVDRSAPSDDEPAALWNVKRELLVPRVDTAMSAAPRIEEKCPLDLAARRAGKQPTGVVVGIVKVSHKFSLVGALKAQCGLEPGRRLPDGVLVFFLPSDRKYADMIIPGTELPDAYKLNPLEMQKRIYVADIDPNWVESSKCPFGTNVRDIGAIGSIYSETEAILTEAGINHPPYVDSEILKGVISDEITDLSGWTIPADEIAKRRDFRGLRIFTIDPYNARDLDDALHITELPDGTFEIGVHIADVSYFVKEGIALDEEAKRRATSIYLVQKVIPMLPPILCEQLCSLNPNVDRLAFSSVWKMNADGTLCNNPAWFGKSVIRSCAKLDYATAQRMVDGLVTSDPSNTDIIPEDIWEFARRPGGIDRGDFPIHHNWQVVQDVKLLHRVAMSRRSIRLSSGALTLNHPKIIFNLDAAGNPLSIGTYTIRDTNKVVEEYMLLANYLVAEQLVQKCREVAFLRRHASPDSANKRLEDITAVTDGLGIYVDVASGKTIQKTLDSVLAASSIESLHAVEALLMRIMTLAEYFVVDHSGADNWRHFALGIPYYTHFTSPIRRYADVIVHRLLFSVIASDKPPIYEDSYVKKLADLADHCNIQKKAAKDVEDKCDRMYLSVYLTNSACEEEAFVISVGKKSFTLLVPRFGIENRIFTDDLKHFHTWYDDIRNTLTLTRKSVDEDHSLLEQEKMPHFEQMEISLMTKVRVYLSSVSEPHLDVKVNLLGPL